MCDHLYDGRDYEDIFGILFIGYVKVWWRCDSVAAITYTNGENTNRDLNLFHSKTYNPIGPISSPISYGTPILFRLWTPKTFFYPLCNRFYNVGDHLSCWWQIQFALPPRSWCHQSYGWRKRSNMTKTIIIKNFGDILLRFDLWSSSYFLFIVFI